MPLGLPFSAISSASSGLLVHFEDLGGADPGVGGAEYPARLSLDPSLTSSV